MKNSFKEMSVEELKKKLGDLESKYFELRFKNVVGHVENPMEKRVLRRAIARLHTRIAQHDQKVVKA